MTASERLIIVDYLTRKRWYFIGGFIIHLIMMTWCWWSGTPIILGIIGGSAFILAFDQEGEAKGVKRTMQSLPITANQLARSWRFVALGFPLIFFMVALLLSTMIGAAFGASYLTIEFFLLTALSQTLSLGFCFYAMTGLSGPSLKGSALWLRIQDIFFVLLWFLSFAAVIYLSIAYSQHFAELNVIKITTVILLAVASIAGWFRADLLVHGRAFSAKPNRRRMKKQSPVQTMESWKRFGALPYLCARDGLQTLVSVVSMILLFQIMNVLFNFLTSPPRSFTFEMPSSFLLVMFVVITLNPLFSLLRVLRTMPIRTSVLTNTLVFLPLSLVIFPWLIVQLFYWSLNRTTFEWLSFSQLLTLGTLILTQLPLNLRFGQKGSMLLFVPLLLLSGTPIASWLFGRDSANSPWLFALTCILLTTIWYSTYRLLGTPHPWRAGALKPWAAARRMQ